MKFNKIDMKSNKRFNFQYGLSAIVSIVAMIFFLFGIQECSNAQGTSIDPDHPVYVDGFSLRYEAEVADYPRYERVEEEIDWRLMVGTIFGGNLVHYRLNDSVTVSGEGLNPAVNLVFHNRGKHGIWIGARWGYTTTSVVAEGPRRRSSWFTAVDVGISDGDVMAFGGSFGYHKSDISKVSSPSLRAFGQFKFPLERSQLIWLNAHGDLGFMFNDQFTDTSRSPLVASGSLGIICRIL